MRAKQRLARLEEKHRPPGRMFILYPGDPEPVDVTADDVVVVVRYVDDWPDGEPKHWNPNDMELSR